jgi:hypothetical protein
VCGCGTPIMAEEERLTLEKVAKQDILIDLKGF